MPTYALEEGTSNKFWKIERDGAGFVVRWGKIGTKGQEKRQDFASPAEAKRAYDKLIGSKLKKGYRCIDAGATPPLAVDDGPVPASLDDPAASLVYADWLQGRNDPRGELITVQHARLTHDTPELRKREAQLLEGQVDALFGGLGPLLKPDAGLSATWRLGFLQSIRVGRDRYDSDLDIAGTLRTVVALPIARHLEAISIGLCQEPDSDGDLQPGIDALIALAPPTVRSLFLGDFQYPDQSDISSTGVGDLTGLARAFPKLRSLRLRGSRATLGSLDFPELREFTFESGGLGLECVEAICTARWPQLERLTVWFGDENYGSEADFDTLKPMLAGTGLGALKHLGLVNCAFLNGNIEALAKAKVLPQLQRLDLSMGTLGDEDAEAFVRKADAFKHLTVDLSQNYLTPRGLWLMRKSVPQVVSTTQNEADTAQGRFVSVGE